ncbi:MAG: hypothetical protein PUG41_00950 [Prevotellaceae bacterium]|nr:hypothetical protein [Prevotellaceae bacterium]
MPDSQQHFHILIQLLLIFCFPEGKISEAHHYKVLQKQVAEKFYSYKGCIDRRKVYKKAAAKIGFTDYLPLLREDFSKFICINRHTEHNMEVYYRNSMSLSRHIIFQCLISRGIA